MEDITQTQFSAYEDVLKQLEEEQNKNRQFQKDNKILDNKIKALALGSQKHHIIDEKLFHCLLKIYNNIFDVRERLSSKISQYEIEQCLKNRNKKYYTVDLYVTQTFQERIIQQNWLINVKLINSKYQVNKSVNVKSKVSIPICMLIPFDDTIEPTKLKITLSLPEGNSWLGIDLIDFCIDISYHFCSLSTDTFDKCVNHRIFQLLSTLNGGFDYTNLLVPQQLQFNLNCDTNEIAVFQSLVERSYHNWDPRKDSCISRANDIITAKFSTGTNQICVMYNISQKILSIFANPTDLYYLKEYFIEQLDLKIRKLKVALIADLEQWKQTVKSNKDDLKLLTFVYKELRAATW